ncbi:macro domain-containing protein [Paenibacillus pasadenensis]|uniref:macro domain-containing protein n=1 Tax=Paenibacillus pasadenensis TaxID=217090 RepID=UPI002040D9F4|nr:macro domain-containing protein [Paenibacillus pasadenensis]MCM3745852.1 macro domain-containing protein [Paenibacillus pasadenensis]
MTIQINSTLLETIQGDITRLEADVIVNAANSSLSGGAGVDGAIHSAGGIAIHDELSLIRQEMGSCEPGEAVVTTAGKLPAAYVIHAVGPVWQGGESGEAKLLAACYSRSLQLADEKNAASIAFPALSTGIYGYPKPEAAEIAFRSVADYLKENEDTTIKRVSFVCMDEENCCELSKQIKQAYTAVE